ncbi:MAG: DUF456 domain-containing protein [Halodesulfurarchaeum sp.]
MNPFLGLAVALMALGVVGSFAPMVPGALASIAGILVYWWSTGFTSPGLVFLAVFVALGGIAVVTDQFSGAIAAKYAGASARNSVFAGIVGILLLFVLGPIGIVIGVAGTVFLLEFREHREGDQSLKAAAYASIGVIGSGVIQFVLTLSLLLAFLIALVV